MMQAQQLQALISLPQWNKQVYVLHSHHESQQNLIALGCESSFQVDSAGHETLTKFQNWLNEHNDWAFGFMSYELKNAVEDLTSRHKNQTGFPDIQFVVPLVVVKIMGETIEVIKNKSSVTSETIIQLLQKSPLSITEEEQIELHPRISKETYIAAVEQLLQHIQQGDIYEVNYCQEFFGEHKLRNPYALWTKLNTLTEAPLAAYMQSNSMHLLCASPERFIQKKGEIIISQPIKGTIRRGRDRAEDIRLGESLFNNQKERSENVMIVDLVRNDLSHVAQKGSVHVPELFGIHSFKTVHHMISTIEAKIKDDCPFTEIIRAMFPMGSMTGAPKIRAMQLIDQYEYNRRGIYSGSIGYIAPNGDFDFNVVIRSLVYNEALSYLSCCVGSAITSQCEPEKEYEECLLKAEALFNSLKAHDAKTTSSDSHIARTAN